MLEKCNSIHELGIHPGFILPIVLATIVARFTDSLSGNEKIIIGDTLSHSEITLQREKERKTERKRPTLKVCPAEVNLGGLFCALSPLRKFKFNCCLVI